MLQISKLTDRELVDHAHITLDVLAATDMQVELLKRFTGALDELEAARTVEDQLADEGIDLDAEKLIAAAKKADALDERVNGIALLDALREHDIDDPAELKKILDRDAKVAAVMEDLARPLASLQALIPA